MNAIIHYQEIADFIEKKVRIKPCFTCLDGKTLEISYKPGFFPSITLGLHIESLDKDSMYITYNCNTAASLMIAGIVKYLEEKIPFGVEVNTKDKCIQIYLNKIDKVENILKHVSSIDLVFEKDRIITELLIS